MCRSQNAWYIRSCRSAESPLACSIDEKREYEMAVRRVADMGLAPVTVGEPL